MGLSDMVKKAAGSLSGDPGGVGGLPGGSQISYSDLKSKYHCFFHPRLVLNINGKDFGANEKDVIISSVDVEVTSDYEASIAKINIANVYNTINGCYVWDNVKNYVVLGAPVTVSLGYDGTQSPVFVGFVAGVNFVFDGTEVPHVEVTAMDIKGVMMANCYSTAISAKNYSDAVKQVLDKNLYAALSSAGAFSEVKIDDTPDAKGGNGAQGGQGGGANEPSRETIEMVAESDYEFVVKVAKKFNFEFFQDKDVVYFRKAKSNTQPLITISPSDAIITFDIGYSLTGLISEVEVRSIDTGKAEAIVEKVKADNKISLGGKAKSFIKKTTKTYIDSSVFSKEQAGYRAESIMENASYRFGTLTCECIGFPEMTPGRFITIGQLGSPAENDFYITHVRHVFDLNNGYKMQLTGKACKLKS